MQAHRFFLVAALVSGPVFVFLIPPFQAPDEPAHFYRAYALSEGRLLAQNVDGRSGDRLPVSLVRLAVLFYDVPGHPERRIAPGAMAQARRLELEPGERAFLDFPGSALFSPLPYLPQAAAIAVGRRLGARPLTLLYLARLLNLLTAATLVGLSLRLYPSFGWLAALLLLSPMAVFLRSSISADALTTAVAALFAAAVARLAFGAVKRTEKGDIALLAVASTALCLTKIPYFPLVLACLLIPADRLPRNRRSPTLLLVLTLSVCACAVSVAIAVSVGTTLSPESALDSEAQILAAFAEPSRFVAIVLRDYVVHGPRYAAELIGRLGWLDTPLPSLLIGSFAALLVLLLALDTTPSTTVEPWQRTTLLALLVATSVLISAAQYAFWTPYRASYVQGIQGRYFYPAALLAPWIFYTRRWTGALDPKWIGLIVALYTVLSLSMSALVLSGRYY